MAHPALGLQHGMSGEPPSVGKTNRALAIVTDSQITTISSAPSQRGSISAKGIKPASQVNSKHYPRKAKDVQDVRYSTGLPGASGAEQPATAGL